MSQQRSVHGNGFGRQLADLIGRRAIAFTSLRFRARETIYRGSAPGDSVFLLAAGRAKSVMHSRTGKNCLLRIHAPGEVLGELALLGGLRQESAIAMCPTEVHRVSAAHLLRVMGSPAVHQQLIRHLSERMGEQQQAISHLVNDDSEHRLGVALLDLADRLGQPENDAVRIGQRLTQEELAEMVGTTRETLAHTLADFRRRDLLDTAHHQVVIRDAERLAEVAQDGEDG